MQNINIEGDERLPPNPPTESSSYTISARYDPPEKPGRDSKEVLTEAGFSQAEVDSLMASGAVIAIAPNPPLHQCRPPRHPRLRCTSVSRNGVSTPPVGSPRRILSATMALWVPS